MQKIIKYVSNYRPVREHRTHPIKQWNNAIIIILLLLLWSLLYYIIIRRIVVEIYIGTRYYCESYNIKILYILRNSLEKMYT